MRWPATAHRKLKDAGLKSSVEPGRKGIDEPLPASASTDWVPLPDGTLGRRTGRAEDLDKLPLQRQVLTRDASGRPLQTQPFRMGNEDAVLEAGAAHASQRANVIDHPDRFRQVPWGERPGEEPIGKPLAHEPIKYEIKHENGMYHVYADGAVDNAFGHIQDAQNYIDLHSGRTLGGPGAANQNLGPEAVDFFRKTGRLIPVDHDPFAAGAARAGGLPGDPASRMARAEAMGFRTDMPLYHGSGKEFSAFQAGPMAGHTLETPGVSPALAPELSNLFA